MPVRRPERPAPYLGVLDSELHKYLKGLSATVRSVYFQIHPQETEDLKTERLVKPGDWVYVKVLKCNWKEPRRKGPFQVILSTPAALKVSRVTGWIHINHCTRASQPKDGEALLIVIVICTDMTRNGISN